MSCFVMLITSRSAPPPSLRHEALFHFIGTNINEASPNRDKRDSTSSSPWRTRSLRTKSFLQIAAVQFQIHPVQCRQVANVLKCEQLPLGGVRHARDRSPDATASTKGVARRATSMVLAAPVGEQSVRARPCTASCTARLPHGSRNQFNEITSLSDYTARPCACNSCPIRYAGPPVTKSSPQ